MSRRGRISRDRTRARRLAAELAGLPPPCTPITDRDLEVFLAVCRAGSQKQAAYDLGIGLQTVKNHCTALYRKLGVESYLSATVALGWTVLPETGTEVRVAARG